MADPTPGPRRVSLTRDLVLRGVPMRVATELIDAPVSPRRLLPVLRSVTDSLVSSATRREAARGRSPSCGAGCSACCSLLAPISRAEAYRLRELVDALPEPQRLERRARFDEARAQIAAAGLLAELQSAGRLDDLDEVGERYHQARIACPFLDAGTCSIYPERPLPCREHVALTPAGNCSGEGEGVERLELPAYPSLASNAMDDGPSMRNGGWVALSLALDYADSRPEPAPVAHAPVLVDRFLVALEALDGRLR